MNENPNEPAANPAQSTKPVVPPPIDSQAPQPVAPAPAPVEPVTSAEPTVISPDSQLPAAEPAAYEPVVPQPAVTAPQPDAFQAAPAPLPQGGRPKKLLFGIVGLVIIIVLAVTAYLVFFSKKVTLADVKKAQSTTESINTDLQTANDDLSDAENADDATSAQAKLTDAKSKLHSAEASYAVLKKSPAVKDPSVKAKFAAVDKKWTPYVTFIDNNASDLAAIDPVIGDFETKIQALTSTSPSTQAELSTYLTTFKSLVDDLSGKTKGLTVKVDANKQIVASFQTFLTTSSQSISKAQNDLAAGNTFGAEDDLFKIDDAESTFESALTTQETQLNKQYDNLVPNDQFSSFMTALNDLENKLNK